MRVRSPICKVTFGLLLGVASGCASTSRESDLLEQRDREIRALQEESSRRAGALTSSQKAVESLRAELRTLTAEKGRLSEELARRQTELEYQEEKARALQVSQRSLQDQLTRSEAETLELRRNVTLASRRLDHVAESVQRSSDATRVPEWVEAEGVPEVRVSVPTLTAVNEELRSTTSALEPLVASLRRIAGDAEALFDEAQGANQDIEVVEAITLTPLIPLATSSASERDRLGETGETILSPSGAGRGGTFLSQLFGVVRLHFLRLFESGRKWDAGDYGFVGVVLLFTALLAFVVLVSVRWILQRPKERELALLRRVVAAGSGGQGDRVEHSAHEHGKGSAGDADEPESCTVIVGSGGPELEAADEYEAQEEDEVDAADPEGPDREEAEPLRPVEVAEPAPPEVESTSDEEPVRCGPPPGLEADPVELASTQEMDRLLDDDLERTRELSREVEDGERTTTSTTAREETAADSGDEVAEEIAYALDAALPHEDASRRRQKAQPATTRPSRVEQSTARADESPPRRRGDAAAPASRTPSYGETQGLEAPGPEDVAQTQEMPRLGPRDHAPTSEGRPSVDEHPRQTQGVPREVLSDGGTTQPLERLDPVDADATRELDPGAHEQFRTTQRVRRDPEADPSSTQELRRRRLTEHQARAEKRQDVEFRLTQEVSLRPPQRRPVESSPSTGTPRETTRSPRPQQQSEPGLTRSIDVAGTTRKQPSPMPPGDNETAPLPGLNTNEYAATQPLPEVLFRSPEPKTPPSAQESRPPPEARREGPQDTAREEPQEGQERSLLSQLERLMGRKIERERG